MTKDENPYKRAAQERKARTIVTAALVGTHKAAVRKAKEDQRVASLRVEHGAQLGLLLACLTGKHGTSVALSAREELLADAHLTERGASPETWKIVNEMLAVDYANLALDLHADDPFAGLDAERAWWDAERNKGGAP